MTTFTGYQTKELTDDIKAQIISDCDGKMFHNEISNIAYYKWRDYFPYRQDFYDFVDACVINEFLVSTGVKVGINPAYDVSPTMKASPNGVMCDWYLIKAPKNAKIISAGDGCYIPDHFDIKTIIVDGRYKGQVVYLTV